MKLLRVILIWINFS